MKDKKDWFLKASLTELSMITGFSIVVWSRWMNSKSSPSLTNVKKIATALDMPWLELVELFEMRRQKTTKAKLDYS